MRSFRHYLIAAIAVTMIMAGCSNHTTRPASPPSTTTTNTRTVAATSQSTATSLPPKQAAFRLARRMLADLVLPPGAQSSHETPPALLATAQDDPGFGNLEDVHNLFTIRAVPTAVVALLMARRPHGYTNGYTSSGTIQGVRNWGIIWTLATSPMNISVAELQVGIVGGQAGTSVVRVDAVVGWTAPRPANEYVSAQDHVVVVTFIPQVDGPVARHRIITAHEQVALLVTVFNQLRVMPPDANFGCPISSGAYRLAYSKSVGVTPDVIAEVGTCRFVTVTIDGHSAPGLDDGPRLVFSTAAAHALA
ncbi:MAG: hypothetical protein ACLPVY_16650 [Acidimicrobiia bacterium]